MPPTWILGRSDKGWMTAEAFLEYISDDFNKWLIQEGIPKPVIVFIDGHKSHMSLPLSEFCDSNGIILYALPPNTTHMLQPADVSVFRPLKQEWKSTVRRWLNRPENINSTVTKLNFCTLFQDTLQGTNMTTQIKNGFRKCGLYPLNPDNIDYSKCVKNTLEKKLLNQQLEQNSPDIKNGINEAHLEIAKQIIKKIEPKLESYGISVQVISNEIDELKPQQIQDHHEIVVGTILPMDELTLVPVQDVILEAIDDGNQNVTPGQDERTEGYENLEEDNMNVNQDDENLENKKIVARNNTESESIEVTEKNESHILQQGQRLVHNESIPEKEQNPSVVLVSTEYKSESNKNEKQIENQSDLEMLTRKVPILDPFESHLSFPNAVEKSETRKNKPKLPSAISSQAWRNYYLKKDQEKQEKVENIKMRKLQKQENMRKKQKLTLKKKE